MNNFHSLTYLRTSQNRELGSYSVEQMQKINDIKDYFLSPQPEVNVAFFVVLIFL